MSIVVGSKVELKTNYRKIEECTTSERIGSTEYNGGCMATTTVPNIEYIVVSIDSDGDAKLDNGEYIYTQCLELTDG